MKEKFIPGIYNYCDRWCERCAFTTSCRNFESTGKLSSEELDINNKAFWESISKNFQSTIEMIKKMADEKGIDLTMTPEESERYDKERDATKQKIRGHTLPKLCEQYRKLVDPFLKEKAGSGVKLKANELVSHVEIGIQSEDEVAQTMISLQDCFEVIGWYLFFMDAKLQRALHGKVEGEKWEVDNGYPKDSDGSAKIAIIAIERSIGAWTKLYELLPDAEDFALSALSILSQLKSKTIEEFPHAMDFKRPGFD